MPTDLQTVMDRFLDDYRQQHPLTPRQAEICQHIRQCRTEALGGVQLHCDQCEFEQPWYCACRDRHCPKCQWRKTEEWTLKQTANVLPVTYYHLVFTLPHQLNPWIAVYPKLIYGLLFAAVWQTLKTFGQDPNRLDGQLGATLVLHTWGQQLWRHVHLHCLVPGGALGKDDHWHPAKSTYLFPQRALSKHFRGNMVSRLRKAYEHGELPELSAKAVKDVLDKVMATTWVVNTQPWLKQPETVINYLARYTFRTAISDARIRAIDDEGVTLGYKDYADHDKWKHLHLSGKELIRRFLLHILPKGLMRIRHYGFLANRCRQQKLAKIRHILNQPPPDTVEQGEPEALHWICPKCHRGQLQVVNSLNPNQQIQIEGG